MAGEWTYAGQPAGIGDESVTLVEGSSFCVCGKTGDIVPGSAQGVFYADTRVLSRWELRLDGEPVEVLTVVPDHPFQVTFVGRSWPRAEQVESALLVERRRMVGAGMREDLTLRNMGGEAAGLVVSLTLDADFADLFEVKAGRGRAGTAGAAEITESGLRLWAEDDDGSRGVRITAEHGTPGAGTFTFRVVVPPRSHWRTEILVRPIVDGAEPPPLYPAGEPVERTLPARRARDWLREGPSVVTADQALARTFQRTMEDLGALRIFDADGDRSADPSGADAGPPAVAAGAPWYMTLFGRDSLLTSLMALPVDPSLALGTLQALARRQGVRDDALSEEEPGKIMHELRRGAGTAAALGGGEAYYGSVDATPLFVLLLGELRRWGAHREQVDELLPHADRALEWIVRRGDRDADGFVEYQRATDRGLLHQGWKDSADAISFADGRQATGPIALAEVQGYVYAAYRARGHLAREAGDGATAEHYAHLAAELKRAFNEAFWLPERGWYAMALDGAKRPVDALASNMGHCMWTGIVDQDKATAVAGQLLGPEMFTGWGVRTLASSMGAYNPMSYHNGSVWPHDNALIAAGLMRYGFAAEARTVAAGVLAAAAAFDGRPPELFCGLDRHDYGRPVPYPTSCSPQAWAAATPIHLLRVLLRLDPSIPAGKLWISPTLPPAVGDLRVNRLRLAGGRVDITVSGSRVELSGLPDGIEVINQPRPAP